jgi:hypothetical protein
MAQQGVQTLNNLSRAHYGATTAAGRAAGGMGKVADKAGELSGKLQGLLDKVPGLTGTSEVTEDQQRLADMGVPQNFADDYLRRLTDEVINGVEWADVDIGDAAARAGIDPNLPAQTILEMFKNAWANSSLFADAQNLDLINMDAVKASIQQQMAADAGKANIMALFGIGDDATVSAVAGLGLDIQSGLGQWLADNGMPEAGAKLAGALGAGITESGIPVDGGLNSWLGSEEGSKALDGYTTDLSKYLSDRTWIRPRMLPPEEETPPNGGSAGPGGSDLPPTGGALGGAFGARGAAATGNVTVNVSATVQQPHDVPLLAKQVAREIQRRS